MKKATDENIGYSILSFIHKIGAPNHLTFDGAAVQVEKILLCRPRLESTS